MSSRSITIIVVLFVFFLVAVMTSYVFFDWQDMDFQSAVGDAIGISASNNANGAGDHYKVEGIMTNLGGTLEPIQVTISMELSPGSDISELEEKDPLIRDEVTMIIRNKAPEDFEGETLEKLKDEIVEVLNANLVEASVEQAYFLEILTPGKEE